MNRVSLTPVYVLHRRPYRNTSLIVDFFSQQHGRVSAVARSARGPKSRYRGSLQPFVSMLAGWSGRGELKSLNDLELEGPPLHLTGKPLLCGLYLNELCLRLLQRDDPYPAVYQIYKITLEALHGFQSIEQSLRLFEIKLLNELGYGILLNCEAQSGVAIEESQYYRFHPDLGFLKSSEKMSEDHLVFRGESLLALHQEELIDPLVLKDAKRLMRMVLSIHLGGKPIASRELLK